MTGVGGSTDDVAGRGAMGNSGGAVVAAGAGGSTLGSGGVATSGASGAPTSGASGGSTLGSGGVATSGAGGAAAGAGGAVVGGGGSGAGNVGSGGTGGVAVVTIPCTVTPTLALSTLIPTVATVTFTTSLAALTSAEIEFGPAAGGALMSAPVNLAQPDYKTVLVGMKPTANYAYRIKLSSSAGTCTSDEYMLTTGALDGAPQLNVTIADAAQHDRGFLVVTKGLSGSGGPGAYIIDPDGDVVWVPPDGAITFTTGRAHLSWDAARLFAMDVNFPKGNYGFITSLAMDGGDMRNLSGVSAVHHDFVAIPGGIATLAWVNPGVPGAEGPSAVIELLDSGETRTVVPDLSTIYDGGGHANSIHYYDSDKSYTVGDPNANAYVKISGAGELVWQFGGENPKDPAKFFAGFTPWQVNHGHHLMADGTFAFFNNTVSPHSSNVLVYDLDTATLNATQKMVFPVAKSAELGDVQRLPNGNFLLTSSVGGVITEVTPAGGLVMTISGQYFGYTEFRESLYGPPPY